MQKAKSWTSKPQLSGLGVRSWAVYCLFKVLEKRETGSDPSIRSQTADMASLLACSLALFVWDVLRQISCCLEGVSSPLERTSLKQHGRNTGSVIWPWTWGSDPVLLYLVIEMHPRRLLHIIETSLVFVDRPMSQPWELNEDFIQLFPPARIRGWGRTLAPLFCALATGNELR